MSNIQDRIIELFYLNFSVDQIAESLMTVKDTFKISNDQTKPKLVDFIEKTLKEYREELEADAYLSSLDCYYDNYCEY